MDFDEEKSSELQISFSSFWYQTQSSKTNELIHFKKIKISVYIINLGQTYNI